jgi:hypothetical protein
MFKYQILVTVGQKQTLGKLETIFVFGWKDIGYFSSYVNLHFAFVQIFQPDILHSLHIKHWKKFGFTNNVAYKLTLFRKVLFKFKKIIKLINAMIKKINKYLAIIKEYVGSAITLSINFNLSLVNRKTIHRR